MNQDRKKHRIWGSYGSEYKDGCLQKNISGHAEMKYLSWFLKLIGLL